MIKLKFIIILIFLLLFQGCILIDRLGGNFSPGTGDILSKLSPGARNMLEDTIKENGKSEFADYHVHVIGSQFPVTGCYMNPMMKTWWHPIEHLRYFIYLSAAGISNGDLMDREYVLQLVKLARSSGLKARYYIFALDKFYSRDGEADLVKTQFYVPNEYVFKLAEEFRDILIPVISINPYRKDALTELEKWAGKGVRIIKWIPNSMGIDPSDESITPFYRMMKKHSMILISHTGEEAAIYARGGQELGNPLLLRKPLGMGIKVIAAHCASLGQSRDIESPGEEMTDNLDLFIRLMEDKRYKNFLFGDISAFTHFNRKPEHLAEIIKRKELHHRLVYGSDYPLPSVNFVIHTGYLRDTGFITEKERVYLNEIYQYNPLLFDLVLKMTVKLPGTNKKFSTVMFQENPEI